MTSKATSPGMTSTGTRSTGISAQGYARRRRQLMRMAGDDAIVINGFSKYWGMTGWRRN